MTHTSFHKKIAFVLLLALCFNTISFSVAANVQAQTTGNREWVEDYIQLEANERLLTDPVTNEVTIVKTDGTSVGSVIFEPDNVSATVLYNDGSYYKIGDPVTAGSTGIEGLFGVMSECTIGGNTQSDLFKEILGPLAAASRGAAILGKLTDSTVLKDLGYTLNGAGKILNNVGGIVGDIKQIANGDLSGILTAAGGISELGSLLDKTGLVDVSGLVGKFGSLTGLSSLTSSLKDVFSSGAAAIGGFIDKSIGSLFGAGSSLAGTAFTGATGEIAGAANALAGSLGGTGAATGGTAAAGGTAGGSAAAAALTVPVNDAAGTIAIGAAGALVSGTVSSSVSDARTAITSEQKVLNEIQRTLQYKEYVLDCTTWNASHRASERVIAEVLDFVNTGNTGIEWITGQRNNPFYLTNPLEFNRQISTRVSRDVIREIDESGLSDRSKNTLVNLLAEDEETTTLAKRIKPTVELSVYNKFMEGDFIGGGGFGTYAQIAGNPCANDPAYRYLCVQEARDVRIGAVANYYADQLDQGQGLFGDTDEEGNIVTPPTYIRDQSSEALSTGMRSLENAQNFWQLVGNMGSIVKDIFKGISTLSEDGNTVTTQKKGLSNVSTPRLVRQLVSTSTTPLTTGPVPVYVTVASKLSIVQTALTNAASSTPYTTSAAASPHLLASEFNALQAKITALKTTALAKSLPPQSAVLAVVSDIDTPVTGLMAKVNSYTIPGVTWTSITTNYLNTARQNLNEILSLYAI
jgi:hypothetical protein